MIDYAAAGASLARIGKELAKLTPETRVLVVAMLALAEGDGIDAPNDASPDANGDAQHDRVKVPRQNGRVAVARG